jgi:hypothetical protein
VASTHEDPTLYAPTPVPSSVEQLPLPVAAASAGVPLPIVQNAISNDVRIQSDHRRFMTLVQVICDYEALCPMCRLIDHAAFSHSPAECKHLRGKCLTCLDVGHTTSDLSRPCKVNVPIGVCVLPRMLGEDSVHPQPFGKFKAVSPSATR